MALDSTAREANIRDSWKKYLIDNVYTTSGYEILFDKSLDTPDLRANTVDRWLSVVFGPIKLDTISIGKIQLIPCTRKDAEGFKLAQLRDTVLGYLVSDTDEYLRIPFYRSKSVGAWDLIGSLLISDLYVSEDMETETGVKFKVIEVEYKFVSKV